MAQPVTVHDAEGKPALEMGEIGQAKGHHLTEDELKHGDAGLRILGEGRVELTEADVSGEAMRIWLMVEQTYSTQDR